VEPIHSFDRAVTSRGLLIRNQFFKGASAPLLLLIIPLKGQIGPNVCASKIIFWQSSLAVEPAMPSMGMFR